MFEKSSNRSHLLWLARSSVAMRLTNEDVRKVASLAKLKIAESELDGMSRKLLSVLDFVEQLEQVDTSGVAEMAHPVDVHSVMRCDQLSSSLSHEAALQSRAAALQNAPRTDGEFFLVPPVLG